MLMAAGEEIFANILPSGGLRLPPAGSATAASRRHAPSPRQQRSVCREMHRRGRRQA